MSPQVVASLVSGIPALGGYQNVANDSTDSAADGSVALKIPTTCGKSLGNGESGAGGSEEKFNGSYAYVEYQLDQGNGNYQVVQLSAAQLDDSESAKTYLNDVRQLVQKCKGDVDGIPTTVAPVTLATPAGADELVANDFGKGADRHISHVLIRVDRLILDVFVNPSEYPQSLQTIVDQFWSNFQATQGAS